MHPHVAQAQEVLRLLGLPTEQTNERSALTLLALLNLTPEREWREAENPMVGVTPAMDFMAAHYQDQPYAPNSRETVRRFTIHQFMDAGVVVQNPDDQARPTNSPNNVYQIPPELLAVLRTFGTAEWDEALAGWLVAVGELKVKWAAEREMARLPVVLPDGSEVVLSGGGQNVLIAQVIEEFCPRFTPGATVLYLGDAGDKFVIDHRDRLAAMGVTIDEHGPMPDVTVLSPDERRLVLIEAVTSHGPINAHRKQALEALFDGPYEIVHVTAFPDMATYTRYAREVAWDTQVWVAENPSHLIHYNGESL
jgi:BsuBI/PstI restriction endonuclease domain/BsuBI/PstI restriction endonuclease HTH domain